MQISLSACHLFTCLLKYDQRRTHARGHKAFDRERGRRRRPVRRRDSARRRDNSHGGEPRDGRQRPYGARRSQRDTPCGQGTRHVQPLRLRDIHFVRAVPDVPRSHLLGEARQGVLRQHEGRRQGRRLRRLVHLRRACPAARRAQAAFRGDVARRGPRRLQALEREDRQDRVLTTRLSQPSQCSRPFHFPSKNPLMLAVTLSLSLR